MPALTQDQKLEGVRALLNPRSVAIVGASDRPGNWSLRVFQTLRRFSFPGPIYPVNPRNKTVWDGETCYPSLSELPEAPDHVVVIVPGAAAIDTIAEAGKVKARSATVFSGGFGEGGDPKGRELAARLRQAIDNAGLAVSGPNCLGNLAAPHRFMTIPDDRIAELELGPVAVVGQSGGIVMAIQRALHARGVKTSYAITSGNEIGLYTSDYIRYLADDPHVKVIVCFIESIRHAAEFRRACEHARNVGKPVVAIKIGGSEESRRAALAHTGSLAGSLQCFDAVAETVGVIRVDTLDEAVEAAEYFSHAPIPKGPRLGGMTFSGGMKGMMLEAAERHGLSFPPLAPETLAKVGEVLGVGTSLGNPLDAGFAALSSAEAYFKCIEILRADPNIDVLLLQEELPPQPRTNNKVDNLRQVDRMVAESKWPPVAIVSMISYMFTEHTPRIPRQAHQPAGAAGDRQGAEGGRRRRTLRRVARAGRVAAPETARRQQAEHRGRCSSAARKAADGLSVLNEADSKELLRAYGIRTPREVIAGSADTAIMAAQDIGYPVVLKLLAAEVQHKSDIGGVMLGIRSDNEMRAAYTRLAQNLAKAQAGRQARAGDRRRAGVRRRRAGARRAARSGGRPGGDVRLRRHQSRSCTRTSASARCRCRCGRPRR